jgi:hypothetical protein
MKTLEAKAKAKAALKQAIRAFTVDLGTPNAPQPNGPAEEASLRLCEALLALPPSVGREIWRLAEIHSAAEEARLRNLRVAAEAFFGGDFKRPGPDNIVGITIETVNVACSSCGTAFSPLESQCPKCGTAWVQASPPDVLAAPPDPIAASTEQLLQGVEQNLRARLHEMEVAGLVVPGSTSVERVPAPAGGRRPKGEILAKLSDGSVEWVEVEDPDGPGVPDDALYPGVPAPPDASAGTPPVLTWQGKLQGTIQPLAVRTTGELPPGEPTQLDWMRAVAKVLDTALARRLWPPLDSSERISTWNAAIQAARWEVLAALHDAGGLLPGAAVVPPTGGSWTRVDLGRARASRHHPPGRRPVAAAASAKAAETLLLYLNGLEMDRGWLLNRVDQLARALVWAIGEEDPAGCRYCFPPGEDDPAKLCQAHQALKTPELPAPPGRLPPAPDVAVMRAAFEAVALLKKEGATRQTAVKLGLLSEFLAHGPQEVYRIVWGRAGEAFGVKDSAF